MSYILDEESGVWVREQGGGIAYSDGPAREKRIYDLIANCKDRSVFSSEIAGSIGGWASEYHLSAKRHFTLRGLDLQPGQSVLELGCGCGAITRYLGESGLNVTSVEGGVPRAATARLRCADLDNVRVYADDFTKFDTTDRFDWVIFVGVLEYAPAFNDAADPFAAYIDVARRHLKPGGKIAIAIENKIGLKYWNGANEDHLRRPYFGINDLYTDTTATTFSRKELAALMTGYGFGHQEFSYAFPDYKICDTLITEAGEQAEDFAASALLLNGKSRSYGRNHTPSFHDGLASATLEKAGLLGEFANSFVMVCSQEPLTPSNTLAVIHNIGKRHPAFTCETVFERKGDQITVAKQRMGRAGDASAWAQQGFRVGSSRVHHVTDVVSYTQGQTEAAAIMQALVRDARPSRIAGYFMSWARHLADQSMLQVEGSSRVEDRLLPGIYVDAVPLNFVRMPDGLHLIDTEWQADGDIPLGWTLVRGLRVMLRAAISGTAVDGPTFDQILRDVIAALELSVEDRSIVQWQRFEKQFRRGAIRGMVTAPAPAPED